jgi:tetratricopeptide (TPR) repeat protein
MSLAPALITRLRQLAPWALILVCAAVAVGAYLPTLSYIFISDDTVYIMENTKLLGLQPTELWRLFIEPYNRYSEFLPLRELSYWFDITLFGLNPAAFRMHNIILYLLCLPLVYTITLGVWRYFRPVDTITAFWAGAVVTALFVLQPSHAEAVVWISGRKDVLSTLFSLLALWFAIRAKREQGLSALYAAATLVALLAAMLSKASAVAVAPVIALLWVMFWRDIPTPNRNRSLLLWPLASLLLAACVALIFATIIPTRVPFYLGVEAVTRSLAVLGWLARLAVSPESRHFFYPVLEDPYLPVMIVLGMGVLLAAVTASGIGILRKRLSLEGFAIIVFFLLCTPSIQLIPYQPPSLVSDRWLALAVWPIGLLIVALAWRLKPLPRTALLLVFALSWSFQTIERSRDWRSYEALIDTDIRAYPGYYLPAAHKIMYVQLKRGLRNEALKTAENISDPAARGIMVELIKTDYAVRDIAVATGNPQEAMQLLGKLEQDIKPPEQTKWNPAMKNFWSTIGFALINEWEFLAKQFPDAAPVRYNAGLWLLKVHKYKEAIVHLRAAAESRLFPETARGTAYKNLGLALMGSGDIAAAEMPLLAALQQSPPDFRAYCPLAGVYKQTGRIEEATRAEADCHSRAPNEETAR